MSFQNAYFRMHIRRLIPSTALLLAFEAAARLGSFTRAGSELHLTQSAVSRQVQALEAQLETELFERVGRTVHLTAEGQAYAQEIGAALNRIRRASLKVYGSRGRAQALRLAVLPIFATKWLMPRMGRFHAEHPEAQVDLHARIDAFDLDMSDMDACITMGDGRWTDLQVQHLADGTGLVVGSPRLLAEQPVRSAADLLQHQLLQVANSFLGWQDCLLASGVDPRVARLGARYEYTEHLIQACVNGQGLGLVADLFVREELRSDALLAPAIAKLVPDHRSYYLIHAPQKSEHPTLVLFKAWLQRETDAERGGRRP